MKPKNMKKTPHQPNTHPTPITNAKKKHQNLTKHKIKTYKQIQRKNNQNQKTPRKSQENTHTTNTTQSTQDDKKANTYN